MKRYKFTKHDRAVLDKARQHYGAQHGLAKTAEELQELGQVLNKILADSIMATSKGAHPHDAVINHPAAVRGGKLHEELADVEILLHQVRRIFGPAPAKIYQQKINREADRLASQQTHNSLAQEAMDDHYQAIRRMYRHAKAHLPVRVHIMGPFGTDDLKGVLESKSDILDAMRYATSLLDPVLEVGPKAANVWADAVKKYYQEKEKTAAPSYIEQLLADHSASYLEEFKKKHGGKDREPLGVPFTSADTVAAQLDKINKDFFNIWADREKAKSTAPKYVAVPAHRVRPGDVVKIKKGLEFTAKVDRLEAEYDCIQGRVIRFFYTMQGGMPATGSVIKPRHYTIEVLAFKDHGEALQKILDKDAESADMLLPAKRLKAGDLVRLEQVPTPVRLGNVFHTDQGVALHYPGGVYWADPMRKIHVLDLQEDELPVETVPVYPRDLFKGDVLHLGGQLRTVASIEDEPRKEDDYEPVMRAKFTEGPDALLHATQLVPKVMAGQVARSHPSRQVHTIMVPAERLRTGDQIMLDGETETVDSCTVQPPEEEPLDQPITKLREEVHLVFTSGHSVVMRVGDTVDQVVAASEQPAPEKRHLLRAVQLAPGTIVKHPRTGQSILVATRAVPIGQSPANFKVHYLGGDSNFNTLDVGQLPSLELQGYVVLADVLAQDITTGHIIVHPDHKELVKVTDVRPAPGGAPQNILIISHRGAGMAVCSEDRSLRLPSLHTVQRVTGWPF